MARASDAIEAALSCYVDSNQDRPRPSAAPRSELVGISLLATSKLALYEAMRESGITRSDLARRLGWRRAQVTRLLDLTHTSRVEHIEQAFRALGKRLALKVLPDRSAA